MSSEFWRLLRWLSVCAAIVGIVWAIAWGNVNMPLPSAEQSCADKTFSTDFCQGLLGHAEKKP